MTLITDPQHLLTVAEAGIAAIETAAKAWLAEDRAAAQPRTSDGRRTSTAADPVAALATTDFDRHRDRDRIGRRLYTLVDQLTALERTVTPRTPSRSCVCCGTATATHGNVDGVPSDCWHCWTYARRAGYRCDDSIHRDRPAEARMCECPQTCCEVCPDRATEGRRLSDRCRKRKERGNWQAA